MVAERCHDIEEFFESDKAAVMSHLVVVDGIGQFCHFGTSRAVSVTELTTFETSCTGGGRALIALTTFYKTCWRCFNKSLFSHLISHTENQ